jgi:riboflavin synthase
VFTGIVEELGSVAAREELADAARLRVRASEVVTDARHGDSISVNGVCLTVVEVTGDGFTADVMRETLDRSALGALAPGDPVNLERAATLATRMGGHLVQGHVDGVGTLLSRRAGEVRDGAAQWEVLTIGLPTRLSKYLVEKGSVTVDGVSLTVVSVTDKEFTVSLIPTTLRLTTLGAKAVGDPVNLEVDVLAKYVERLLEARA